MTYKDILYVVTTYESRSISAAAESLYISQSALSQAIRKLENELGTELFVRTGTRLEPTRTCDFFVSKGRGVLRVWNRFDSDLRHFIQGRQDDLNIGLPANFYTNLLPYVLPRYSEAHPEVKVHVLEELSGTLEKMVMQNTLDFCLVREPIQTPGLASVPVLVTELLLALPENHPFCAEHPYRGLDRLETVDLALLKDTPFTLMKHQRIEYLWRPLFAANGFEPIIHRRSREWQNIKYCVRMGKSAAIIDETAARSDPEQGGICYYRISRGNVLRRMMLVFHPDKSFSEQEQWFLDMVREYPTINKGKI